MAETTLDYETFKSVNAKLNDLVLNTLSLLEGQKKLKSESVERINQALSDALQQIQAQGDMQAMETKLNAKIQELETKIEEIKQTNFQERATEAAEELKQKSAQITGAMLKTMTASIERIKAITKQASQSKELKRRLLPDAYYQQGLCFAEVEEGFNEEFSEDGVETTEGSEQTSDGIIPRFRPCGWTDFTQMEKNLHYKRLTFLGSGGNHWGFSYAQNNGQGLVKSFDISEHKITHMICGYLNYFGFTKDRTKMLVMGYNHSGMLGVGHANAV
ncbi:hypothetical protein, partial [Helicobacter sp.]|uniref:hypothetical protein n=1 Tax=Helicobacter sp. TaxID=218 RepID=UPI002A75A8F4